MSRNKGLKIKFYSTRLWQWQRWECEGIDPWNKYHWKVFTPLVWIGWFDANIPDNKTDDTF